MLGPLRGLEVQPTVVGRLAGCLDRHVTLGSRPARSPGTSVSSATQEGATYSEGLFKTSAEGQSMAHVETFPRCEFFAVL